MARRPRLACADFTFPLLTHEQSLDLVATLGFKGVDIGLFQGRSQLQPAFEFANLKRNARRLKRKLDERGLLMADLFLQTSTNFEVSAVNNPRPGVRRKNRDWFLKTLDYGAECGGRHVTGTPGIEFPGRSHRQSLDLAIEELAWRVERIKPYGMTHGVEAHIRSIVPTPRQAQRLIEAVPGLTLTLDYAHFTYTGTADSTIDPLVAHDSHFHIRGGRRRRLQCNFDENVIDFARLYRAIVKVGYRGWLGVEYVWTEWEHCNWSDNLSETIRYRNFLLEMGRSVK